MQPLSIASGGAGVDARTDDAYLRDIAARARTLPERLVGDLDPAEAASAAKVRARVEALLASAAGGDPDKLARRLAWSGWDEAEVRRARAGDALRPGAPLPSWTGVLREALDAAPRFAGMPDDPEIAFAPLYTPFLAIARRRLAERAGDAWSLLTPDAHAELLRTLLLRLDWICVRCLHLEHALDRAREQPWLGRLLLHGAPPDAHYRAFVERLLRGGLRAFFREYSVLARLVATAVELWVEASADLLAHLAADWDDIARAFPGARRATSVTRVTASISDPHNRGRGVAVLTFDSGRKLGYKPKNPSIDAAYNAFLAAYNRLGAPLPLRPVAVLSRATHGWVELVEHAPCADADAARRFYQRAGALACILYAFGATDCHQENVVAAGEHLVLVDVETLMQPRMLPRAGPPRTAEVAAQRQFLESVLWSGLVPRWEDPPGAAHAGGASGLGGVGPKRPPAFQRRWEGLGTDEVTLVERPCPIDELSPSTALPDGGTLSPSNYIDDIVDGFERTHRFLEEQRDALLAEGGPLAALASVPIRFVFRATRLYGSLLQNALLPQHLRDGADWSIALEALSRALLVEEERPRWWGFLGLELAAMARLDIPYFQAGAGDLGVTTIDGAVVNDGEAAPQAGLPPQTPRDACFAETGHRWAIERFRALGPEDRAIQAGILRSALHAKAIREPDPRAPTAARPGSASRS